MTSDRSSLWKHLVREGLRGNRGLTKAVMIFLPWAVILTLREGEPGFPGNSAGFFKILLAVVCWILVCILVNDLADRREDRKAGKLRWIARLPLPAAGFAVLALFGAGLAVVARSRATSATVPLYIAASAFGLLYSLEPFRFKRRGAWGILFYSLAGTAAYAALPWAWMGAPPVVLAALAPAVFLDKWVNVHFHQVIDYESDLRLETRTYAVRAGLGRARKTLRFAAGLAALWFAGAAVLISLMLSSGWRVIIPAAVTLVVLGGARYSAASKRKGPTGTPLVRALPFLYLGLSYALFRVIPLVLIVRLALRHPAFDPAAVTTIVLVGAESLFVYSYRYE